MRVFPLEGRQEKRLLLSYTQKLPTLYGRTTYRFPAGHSLRSVRDWSFHASVKDGAALGWGSDAAGMKATKDGADLLLDAAAQDVKLDRDVTLDLSESEKDAPADEAARFASAEQDGARYFMVRYRPQLTGQPRRQRRDWVFLFESSGDRDPLLARAQIEVVRSLLGQAEPDDTFAVLAAGTRVHAFARELQPVTPENVQAAVAFLEGVHLIGALDLERALKEAEPFAKAGKDAHLVHVGSGIAAMGEHRADVLVKHLPEGGRYVGIGVGRRWDRAFMKQAAERTGGYFTQINPDEPISWRGFELAATLNTPRLLDVRVIDDAARLTFLGQASAIAQGEEVCAIARLNPGDKALPRSVIVKGTLDGQAFRRELPVKEVAGHADYLPRTWAQLEIDRLLAEDAVKHKEKIVALSKAMYVMTPYTSLLVLENEDMYVQYKVDRGRQDHWAMYPCPAIIPVVYEPLPGMPADLRAAAKGQKPSVRNVYDTIMTRDISRSVPALKARYHMLHRGGKYQEAEMLAMRAHELDPDDPVIGARARSRGPVLPQPVFLTSVDFEHYRQVGLPPARVGEVLIVGNEATRQRAFGPPILSKLPTGALGRLNFAPNFVQESGRHLENPPTNQPTSLQIDSFLGRMEVTERMTPERMYTGLEVGRGYVKYDLHEALAGKIPLYQRPTFTGDDRLFYDLAAYAPGMDTSWADVRAVLEAEAVPEPHALPGRIDPAARTLIDQARAAGWQALMLPAADGRPAHTIVFDGRGRFVAERTRPPGIGERVVCDGTTLLHLYPDLGIGARRGVSRFHRADLAGLVPWAVPPADDLAHGADVKRIAERTIAVIPRDAPSAKGPDGKPLPYGELHLLFAEDGRLAERRLVEMPANKTLSRQLCGADGVVKLLDADGKEVVVRKGTLAPAEAPDLTADTKKLVVLPLPYRSRDHVRQVRKIDNQRYADLRFADALELFAAEFAAGNGDEALKVFRESFHGRDQRQLGFYVLLAACGQNLDAEHADVLAEHLDAPLAQYLALYSSPVLRKHASQWAVGTGQWAAGFLHHLALTHALYQRWQSDKTDRLTGRQRQAERDRALDYVRRNQGSAFGWGLLCLLQDRAGKDGEFHRQLAELCPLFADVPGLGYAARYVQARSLWKGGRSAEARKQFQALYDKTLQDDVLPPIDADFRQALAGSGPDADQWSQLLRQTAQRLIDRKHRPAVLALAWQCWQLDDQPLANRLLAMALDRIPDDKTRLPLRLAAIDFFVESGQLAQADALLQQLLDDPKLARRAALWRLAVQIAERRDRKARALACLERALDAEYREPPEALDLRTVRAEYGQLLQHYQALADAMVTLELAPPADFRAKVVRTADRWRALDGDGAAACQAAAHILQTLGDQELAWDYLTTPVGQRPRESGPWAELAQALGRQGTLDLADRALAAACAAEPTNAQLLWDRAQNLRQAGKAVEAQKLYRQLAEGQWQPRFTWVQAQARRQLNGSE
jgi:Tfp pilus assembly protein PilF